MSDTKKTASARAPSWRQVAEGQEAAIELMRRELADAVGVLGQGMAWPQLLASVKAAVQSSIRHANEAHGLRRELEPLKKKEEVRQKARKEKEKAAKVQGSGLLEIVRSAHPTGHLRSRTELREWAEDHFRGCGR